LAVCSRYRPTLGNSWYRGIRKFFMEFNFSSLIDVFMLNILVQNRSAVNAGIAETYGRIQLDAYYKN